MAMTIAAWPPWWSVSAAARPWSASSSSGRCWRSLLFGIVYAGASLNASLVGDGSILFGLRAGRHPISVAIAVLRYRLYAIDHIISRTIGWAVVTAVLVARLRRRASSSSRRCSPR